MIVTGGRGSSSGGGISAFSEYYQKRLKQIEYEIKQKQITASFINDEFPGVRKKAKNAIKRIETLDKQYEQIRKAAIEDLKYRKGLKF